MWDVDVPKSQDLQLPRVKSKLFEELSYKSYKNCDLTAAMVAKPVKPAAWQVPQEPQALSLPQFRQWQRRIARNGDGMGIEFRSLTSDRLGHFAPRGSVVTGRSTGTGTSAADVVVALPLLFLLLLSKGEVPATFDSSYQATGEAVPEALAAQTCEPLTCSPPQLAPRYAHDCTGITLGKSCTVDCAQGYELDGGLSRLRCTVNGSFEGDLPTCSPVPCANTVPTDPAFEKTPCDGLVYQGQCDVTCNPGFQANTTTLSCNSQGALIGTLPVCQSQPCDGVQLDRPELLSTCDGVVNGQNCSVFCARGYEAAAGAGLEQLSCIFTGSTVELLGQLPTCTASPCTEGLPLPSDRATNNCSELFFQESCVENCIEGYTGTTPHFVCASDGTATRDSNSFCRPEQCDSKVLPSLLLHTCENVSFGENCYAYCPPGYVADELAARLRCLGPSSSEPAVAPSEEDSVTLRGTVPQCVASQCLYNLPWGERYVHNCSAVVTGQHCLVSCAEGWFGTVEVLTCQATGDLSGAYPACRTITQTTTRTMTVTQPEPVLVKGSGGYLVTWSQQNASQEHPIASLAVEQSLRWLLNATALDSTETADAVSVSVSVEEINGTEDAADILFEIELPTQNATALLAQLIEIFEEKEHVLAVQAALRNTGLDSLWNASILEFFINISVSENENLTADLAYVVPQVFQDAPLEELPGEYLALISSASVLVCLCCTVAIYIYVRPGVLKRQISWEDNFLLEPYHSINRCAKQ
eukprot:s450_g39.t2